jgi:outer membrane protein assembly factor BamB
VIVGTFDNGVHARDVLTGAPRWHAQLPGTFFGSAAIAGATAYIGTLEGSVYALDVETGALRWAKEFARTGALSGTPAVQRGRVFAGYASGQMRAFRASDGKALWTRAGFGPILGSPMVAGSRVVFGGGDRLWALNQTIGYTLFEQPTFGAAPVASTPTLADEVVWIRTRDRVLRGFDEHNLGSRFGQDLGGDDPEPGNAIAYASPAAANGVIYVPSSDERLYAFDTINSAPLASVPTIGEVWGSPAIANGRVWVASTDTRCLVCSFVGGP